MTTPKKKKSTKSTKKRKGKIRFSSSARLIEKNDATKVEKPQVVQHLKLKSYVPDNGATFKIRILRK